MAFLHVDTTGWDGSLERMAIAGHPEVEEIHSVVGNTCMLLKVRSRDAQALEGLLGKLYATPGVKATRSYVVLSTDLERPAQPQHTEKWSASGEPSPIIDPVAPCRSAHRLSPR